MIVTLKDYQQRALDCLRDFLAECARTEDAHAAFQSVTKAWTGEPRPYFPVQMPALSGLPYVCLRVPTGGGKTLLASHAAGLAMRQLLRADRAVVLWLVPSNTILEQTAKALSDNRHPYRRALEVSVGGPVEVMTIGDALTMSAGATEGQTLVIVSTIQCFRVEDQTGRRVYSENGAMSEHLLRVPPERLADLEPGADGKPRPSLANVLRLHRPIVIVDEAHNARTELSFATLAALKPSCIIEFTATPALEYDAAKGRYPSNVLYRASAAELKAAAMIKLPLRVVTRAPSQGEELLAEAVTLRADLEKVARAEAQATGEYIRPILLIQAESIAASEPLRDRLVSEPRFAADEVRISTGKLDELKDVRDVSSPDCPVRCIITVEKLKEGWDCPFAYVLCSLRPTRSATAIEQIVGRVLRLPRVELKRNAELNCAYVFSLSDSLPQVLDEFRQALQGNGFTSAEAERIIIPQQPPATAGPLFAPRRTVTLDPAADFHAQNVAANAPVLRGRVFIDAHSGAVEISAPLTESDKQTLFACVTNEPARERLATAAKEVADAAAALGAAPAAAITGYERREPFRVPRLALHQGDWTGELDRTYLLERPWRLSDKDARLDESDFPRQRPAPRFGDIDTDGSGRAIITQVSQPTPDDFIGRLHQHMVAFANERDWTVEDLVQWFDHQIEHRDIPAAESAAFLSKALRGLMAERNQDIGMLALDRYRLRDALTRKIDRHRTAEHKAAFQALLLPDAPLTVDDACAVDFNRIDYDPSEVYNGPTVFQKHYFGKPGDLKPRGEEYECACWLDDHPMVKYWVRNLSRRPTSFRLQTSTDYFYPDFVCLLEDARILVVEYKGKDRYDAVDAEEKRAVGAVWEGRSNGRCLFVMPTERNWQAIKDKMR